MAVAGSKRTASEAGLCAPPPPPIIRAFGGLRTRAMVSSYLTTSSLSALVEATSSCVYGRGDDRSHVMKVYGTHCASRYASRSWMWEVEVEHWPAPPPSRDVSLHVEKSKRHEDDPLPSDIREMFDIVGHRSASISLDGMTLMGPRHPTRGCLTQVDQKTGVVSSITASPTADTHGPVSFCVMRPIGAGGRDEVVMVGASLSRHATMAWISSDKGHTWREGGVIARCVFAPDLVCVPTPEGCRLLSLGSRMCGEFDSIFASDDRGMTWTRLPSRLPFSLSGLPQSRAISGMLPNIHGTGDVVLSAGRVYWVNAGGDGLSWTQHSLRRGWAGVHSIHTEHDSESGRWTVTIS